MSESPSIEPGIDADTDGPRFPLPNQITFDNLAAVRHAGELFMDEVGAASPGRPASRGEAGGRINDQTDDSATVCTFDLSGIVEANSLTVALLIAWFRHAHRTSRPVRFVGVPDGVQNIIDVSELSGVLPVEKPVDRSTAPSDVRNAL